MKNGATRFTYCHWHCVDVLPRAIEIQLKYFFIKIHVFVQSLVDYFSNILLARLIDDVRFPANGQQISIYVHTHVRIEVNEMLT